MYDFLNSDFSIFKFLNDIRDQVGFSHVGRAIYS